LIRTWRETGPPHFTEHTAFSRFVHVLTVATRPCFRHMCMLEVTVAATEPVTYRDSLCRPVHTQSRRTLFTGCTAVLLCRCSVDGPSFCCILLSSRILVVTLASPKAQNSLKDPKVLRIWYTASVTSRIWPQMCPMCSADRVARLGEVCVDQYQQVSCSSLPASPGCSAIQVTLQYLSSQLRLPWDCCCCST
jgi:hypothetical protein